MASQIDGKVDNGTRRNAPPVSHDTGTPVPPEVQSEAANASASEVVAITRPRAKNNKKTVTTFIGAAALVVLMIAFIVFLQGTSKKQAPVVPNSPIPQPKQTQQPTAQPQGTPSSTATVPTDQSAQNPNTPALGTPNTTPSELLQTRKQQPGGADMSSSTGGSAPIPSAGASSAPYAQQNNALGNVGAFVPPTVGANGTPSNWTPPAYNGQAATGGGYVQNPASYHKQVAQASMVFVESTTTASSAAGQSASSSTSPSSRPGAASSHAATNFGYEPGYHLSAKLELAACTATAVPVIAVIQYDYRKDGILVVPAGSRAIGTLQRATSSGIIGMHFTSLRLPTGQAIPINAVGLNTQMGSLKGIVTGRNRGKQFLTVALAGLGQSMAMFTGNNSGTSFSQGDMVRAELAQNIGSAADQTVQQMAVSEQLVVTVPAGTPIEVTFIDETPQGGSGSGSAAK